jgi:hypothetical protein
MGYFYAYSNYAIYDRLTDDGLTELASGLSIHGAKPRRLPKALPTILPTLLTEEKKPGGFALGKPIVSTRPAQKLAPSLSRSRRPFLLKTGAR